MLETALMAPILALLLWGTVFLIRAFHARLELLDLTREFAVLIARHDPLAHQDRMRKSELKAIALRMGMDPKAVDMKIEPLLGMSVSADKGILSQASGATANFVSKMALGERLTVTYQPPIRLPFFRGRRFQMEESVALKTNPWKHPSETFLKSFFE